MFRGYASNPYGYLGAYVKETGRVLNPAKSFTSPSVFERWLRAYYPNATIVRCK